MALIASSCTAPAPTPSPTPLYGAECDTFRPDPADEFMTPVDVSYHDAAILDWPIASPSDVDLDEGLLNTAADNAALSTDIQSLLIVRHGKLVFERYFNGSDAAEANTVASLSKSILSVVTGIAIDDGLFQLDSTIGEFLPADLVGQHGDLTVENLLTMSGGLANSEDSEYLEGVGPSDVPGEPSFVRAVLKQESVAPAGSEFAYSTGLTQVLAAIVTETTGRSLCAYTADRLFGPLAIDVEKWWVEPDGYFAGGHSVFITPREIARFGQFVLQHGQWEGSQLVTQSWLDKSLAERWDRGCRGILGAHQGYGFLWWLYEVDGYRIWNASGYGAQDLAIMPDLDLLIVVTHDAVSVGDPNRHEIAPGMIARAAVFPGTQAPRTPLCPQRPLHGFTINPDGSERAPIVDWPAGALPWSWSDGGTRVVVSLDGLDLNSEIYTVAADGTGLTRLTRDLAFDYGPALSPDGSQIAFARGVPEATDLYLMSVDGSGPVRLTDYEGYEHSPTWSPDGTRIAFVREHKLTKGFGESGQLWAIDADGSNPTLLLDQSLGFPAWSPDGRHIAVEQREGDSRIVVLDLETGRVSYLGKGFVPRWSPDGSRLAFVGGSGDKYDIFVMDPDGTNLNQITDDAAFDTLPVWSPDGQQILYVSALDP